MGAVSGKGSSAFVFAMLGALAVSAAAGNDAPGTAIRDCADCPAMRVVRAGTFEMGSADTDPGGEADERPQHRVSIRSFAIGIHEVTVAQFARFVAATDHDMGKSCQGYESGEWREIAGRNWRSPGFPQDSAHPVVCVSWNDVQRYLQWLSATSGRPYRLPTESEWEYVARAGDARTVSHDDANYGAEECCAPLAEGKDRWLQTAPVGSFAANAYGVHDVRGNVWEWLEDCYHESYRGALSDGSARKTDCSLADRRALRGGSWGDAKSLLRPAYRLRGPLDGRYFTLGFRVARDAD